MNKSDKEEVFHKTSINWYPGHMAKTKRLIGEKLELIDIIYEVIDARIPYSSKIKDIDTLIKNKPRILIITKIDLADKDETIKWKNYYEKLGYTVITTDLTNDNDIKRIIIKTNELLKPINDKRAEKNLLPRIFRAAIIGIPNVGKSTLINKLVNKKIVNVGNRPGVTKNIEWIRINKDIELLDTPGILWPKLDEVEVSFNLASTTAIKEEILPMDEVSIYILNKLNTYYPTKLKDRYGISKIDDDVTLTIEKIGKKMGSVIKGGNIDYDKVYSIIINDIKDGKIKGITFDRI